jgi:hypothetical protein
VAKSQKTRQLAVQSVMSHGIFFHAGKKNPQRNFEANFRLYLLAVLPPAAAACITLVQNFYLLRIMKLFLKGLFTKAERYS